jgi:hypothetical protein
VNAFSHVVSLFKSSVATALAGEIAEHTFREKVNRIVVTNPINDGLYSDSL